MPEHLFESDFRPMDRPAQVQGENAFDALAALLQDAGDRFISTKTIPTEAQKAATELEQSIDRLQPEPYEPGAAKLATDLAKLAINGDVNAIEKLLAKKKDSNEFAGALEQAGEALHEGGILLTWDEDKEILTLTRPPSFHINGPKGAAIAISAKGEATKAYSVEYRPFRKGEIDDVIEDPFIYSASNEAVGGVATDIGSDCTKRLAKQHDQISDAIETVKMHGALEHAGGLDKVPQGEDKVTPLAVAILERRMLPLTRAVRAAKDEAELTTLASDLNARLKHVGLVAEVSSPDGVVIGMYSKGLDDGRAIVISRKPGDRIAAFTLIDRFEDDRPFPAVWRRHEGQSRQNCSAPEALRAMLRRAREHNLSLRL